jgi:hypothetical protein
MAKNKPAIATNFQLSDLRASNCRGFTACGEIAGPDAKGIRIIKPFILSYKTGSSFTNISGFFKKSSGKSHLHIDVWRSDKRQTGDGHIEAINSYQFKAIIGTFIGKQVSVSLEAHYEAQKTQLNPKGPLSLLQTKSPSPGAMFRPTGFELWHRDPQSDKNEWQLNFYDVDSTLFAVVEMSSKVTIADSYLKGIQAILESMFVKLFNETELKNVTA